MLTDMNIKEIISDIFSDLDTIDGRLEENRHEAGRLPRYDRYGRRGSNAFLYMLIPHILGFVVGLAVARLFSLGTAGFLLIGSICALAGGIYKSVSFDRISLKPAIARNVIILAAAVVMLIIAARY